jgi:hypothetical protein
LAPAAPVPRAPSCPAPLLARLAVWVSATPRRPSRPAALLATSPRVAPSDRVWGTASAPAPGVSALLSRPSWLGQVLALGRPTLALLVRGRRTGCRS